jgi:hypothetical protein
MEFGPYRADMTSDEEDFEPSVMKIWNRLKMGIKMLTVIFLLARGFSGTSERATHSGIEAIRSLWKANCQEYCLELHTERLLKVGRRRRHVT